MPKAVSLTPDLVDAPQIAPQAATPARAMTAPPTAAPVQAPSPKGDVMPLQVRLPRQDVRAIKIAAAEREQSISEFMLACFHAYMK